MDKLPRIIEDDLTYHAINPGNVFADDSDHRAFLEAIARTRERYPFHSTDIAS